MRVLIIEDDPSIQKMLGNAFKAKNALPETVYDGKEALKCLSKNNYDVAIVDLMLPNLNGEEVIRKVREFDRNLTIVVVSSAKSPSIKKRMFELGADDYVEKPFSFKELYARVQAKQRRVRRGEPTQHLRVEDLYLIPENRTAIRGKKKVELGNTEYKLLEYLMMQVNKVVTRQDLMEKVWGYYSAINTNTIHTHVNRLRQKIDKGFRRKLIKTIHRVGYMIEEKKPKKANGAK